MKRAHSPAVPSLDLLEGLPAPPVVDSAPPCPLMLLRRSRIASQPISVGDNNNDINNTNSSRKMDHGTPSTTTTTAAAAVAGLRRPSVLRTMSDSCIPRAPRMSSSEPNPLFLESLPQLSLPPPSVEDGEALAIDTERGNSGGGQKLSSSLRERMGSLAANFMHFTATSCPGFVGDATGVAEWQLDQDDETRSAATGLLLGARDGGTTKTKVASSSASLTALSLLVSKASPTAGAGAAGAGAAGAAGTKEDRGHHGVLTGVRLDGSSLSTSLPAMQLPPPALAVSTTPRTTTTATRHGHAHAHGERKEGEAPFSFSAFTASTAATTASSVSSAGDGLEEDEDGASAASSAASALSSSSSSQASEGEMEEGEEGEEAVGSPSADAAMGPFVLEELSLEH